MLVKAGLLIDGAGGCNRQAYVRICQGKIAAIGKEGDFAALDVSQAVDFSDYTVMPGLIDAHVHLFLEGITDMHERSLRWKESKEITLIRAVKNVEQALRRGVTTVRDLGGPHRIGMIARQAVKRGIIRGPRVLTANQAISITGGHFHYAGGREADGVDEMARAVREQVKAGAGWIKIMMTGSVDFRTQQAGAVEMTPAETQRVLAEARRLGRPVACHANGREGVMQAVAAGIDSLEHGALLDEGTIDWLAAQPVYWVPTLVPFQKMRNYGLEQESALFPPDGVEPVYHNHMAMVSRAIAAGIHIVAGTDAGALGVEHGDVWQEVALLVEAGMPCMQALQAATGLAAKMMGLQEQVGTLQVGKQADLLIVAGNPLQDITCLNKVVQVYQAGCPVLV